MSIDGCQLYGEDRARDISYIYNNVHILLVMRWNDNSAVPVPSNCIVGEPTDCVSRWSKHHGRRIQARLPNSIFDYNKNIGGVNRTANRVRSGLAATPAAKHLLGYRESKTCMCGAATCDLGQVMTNCKLFGERPNETTLRKWSCAMAERRCRHDMMMIWI